MSTARDIAVWERVIGTSWDELPADAAAALLRLTFSERDLRRMSSLSEKSTDAPLRAAEQAELENYATVSRILALMHSRARRVVGAGRAAGVRPSPKPRRKSK